MKDYIFSNDVTEIYKLMVDLPSLLFASNRNGEIEESSNEKFKMKIIEKQIKEKIVFDYDFMESDVGITGQLTINFDVLPEKKTKINLINVVLDSRLKKWQAEQEAKISSLAPKYHHLSSNAERLVRCQPHWLEERLDTLLKRQDITKLFVKVRAKIYLVEEGSGLSRRGFSLNLSGLEITDIKNEVKGLEGFTELTELDLRNNKIKEITGLEKLTNLKTLYLEDNQIEWISGLDTLSKLEKLYLSGNKIREIEGLENLPLLHALYLDFNQISKIRGLQNLEKLEFLNIKGNPISEEKINELGGFRKNMFGIPLDAVRFPQRFVRYCKRPESERKKLDQAKQIEEETVLKKIQKFIEGSNKIRLSMLRSALDIDKQTFDSKIFEWATSFDCKIDGDFLIKEEVGNIGSLDLLVEDIENWEEIYCDNCGPVITAKNQRICEHCGKGL